MLVKTSTPTLRLKSAEDVWKGSIRRSGIVPEASDPDGADPAQMLADELERLAKKFRKRVRKRVLGHGKEEIDEAVHDLRTSTRKLLAHLMAFESLGTGRLRKAIRDVESVLKWTGSLRDIAVEEARLKQIRPGGIPGFVRDLRGGQGRRIDRLNRRLSTISPKRIQREVRRLGDVVRDTAPRKVLKTAMKGFDRVRDARLALDPAHPKTLHQLRISIKHFRYVMETLQPALREIPSSSVTALHKLQTSLGDMHDLESLESDLAARVKGRPEDASPSAGVLEKIEERHSALLRSFLKAETPILESWDRSVAEVKGRAG